MNFFYIRQHRVYLTLPTSFKMFLVGEDAINFELLDTNFHLWLSSFFYVQYFPKVFSRKIVLQMHIMWSNKFGNSELNKSRFSFLMMSQSLWYITCIGTPRGTIWCFPSSLGSLCMGAPQDLALWTPFRGQCHMVWGCWGLQLLCVFTVSQYFHRGSRSALKKKK